MMTSTSLGESQSLCRNTDCTVAHTPSQSLKVAKPIVMRGGVMMNSIVGFRLLWCLTGEMTSLGQRTSCWLYYYLRGETMFLDLKKWCWLCWLLKKQYNRWRIRWLSRRGRYRYTALLLMLEHKLGHLRRGRDCLYLHTTNQ